MTALRKWVLVVVIAGMIAVNLASQRQVAAAGLDGTTYVEIAPTFNGSAAAGGNQSYIRLGNSGTATTTYNITVLGSPSGTVYGTAAIQVPANASPQYSLSQILTDANAGALANGDTSYSLYLHDSDSNLSYQHVIYNSVNQFFENASACQYVAGANYTDLNSILYNVHTSLLAGYPAQVYVHNYSASSVTYNVSIYDNNTGSLIGTVPITVAANSTYSQPFTYFQQQLNWTPLATEQHANMVFQATGSATYEAEVEDFIYNQQLAAYVNMTQRCGFVGSTSSASSTATTTTFEGTVAGSNGRSGSITVTVQTSISSASVKSASIALSAVERTQDASVAQASGVLTLSDGTTVALTGTYNPSSNTLTFSGGGYSFTGTVSGGNYAGTYTGPSNTSGAVSAQTETQSLVTPYCGSYSSSGDVQVGNNAPVGDSGVFNIQVSASGSLSGEAISTTNTTGSVDSVSLNGSVNGSSLSGTSSEGISFTGTISSGSISGSMSGTHMGAMVSGSFSGSTSNCSHAFGP